MPRHHPSAHSRDPTALPNHRPLPALISISAFVGFYSGHSPRLQELKHFADQAKHRKPIRPLKPFLRYPCSSSRCSRRYPTLLGETVTVCAVLPNRHCLHRESLLPSGAIVLGDFGGSNGEASPYPSAKVVHGSAPSPAKLTGKPVAFSSRPLMVELFTVRRFAPDRRTSHVRFGLLPGSKLPTPARLNEVDVSTPNPRGRDYAHHADEPHPL